MHACCWRPSPRTPQRNPTPGPATPVQSPRHAPPLPTLNTFDLKFHPQDVAYTDGSAPSTQRMGMTPSISTAAVWWELPTQSHGGHQRLLLPPSPGTPVVNRAELTAILWALRHTEKKVIATDSMVAIHQIRGWNAVSQGVVCVCTVAVATKGTCPGNGS
jgi:hypothetical protein